MKTKILLFATAILMAMSFGAYGQAPEKFNYQGIARDNTGAPLANQALGIQISILNPANTALYVETHNVNTNDFGLYSLAIGDGTVVSGTFGSINWAGNPKKIKVEIDPNGGTNYTDLGTTELLSVPYALYAAESVWENNSGDISYSGGNVGVGTTSPSETLHVSGGNRVAIFEGATNQMYIQFHENGIPVGYMGSFSGADDDVDFGTVNGSTAKTHIVTGATPRITVDKDGYVGIGNTTPNNNFEIAGVMSADGRFVNLTPSGVASSDDIIQMVVSPNTASGYQFIEANNGTENVFVLQDDGTIATKGFLKFENGSDDWSIRNTIPGYLDFYYNGTSVSYINSSGVYFASDRRLKENIQAAGAVLERVSAIEVMRYNYKKDEANKEVIGYIAQNLKKQFPEFVMLSSPNEEGIRYYGVNYAGMSAVAIKAIQEQQKIIEKLEARIAKLEQAQND